MQRKIIAGLVAGIVASPAAVAQSSNVQLYGRANLGVDYYKASGARDQGAIPGSQIDYEGRARVFDNSSRVGVRGTEDLGNGLKAIFQIETGVNIDNGSQANQAGTANGSTGFWASRDSYVGLDSNWGRLTLGRQSVFYSNGVNAQFASNYINTEVPWTDGRAFGRVRAVASRQSNVVLYTTPTFFGLNLSAYYAPNAEAVQHDTSADTDGRLWGATLRGSYGPFYAQYDYANNQGNSPIFGTASPAAAGAVRSEQSGHKAGLSWGYMPGARVGFIWSRLYDNAARGLSAGDEVYQDGWALNWEHTFGSFQVMAQYGQLLGISSCDSEGAAGNVACGDSGASSYMLGARYFMSKRTWLYASYNATDNKQNQFADYTNAGYTSVGTTTVFPYGADPRIFAVGVLHNF